MASINDSSIKFFSKATSDQWLFVLSQYKEVFKVRAQATRGSKKSGPQEAIKLDNWYQEELPKLLQSRKDKHVRHEELVQITKWKLWRTKNRSGLLDLVRINTETAVKQISTKAFKKCPTNLHGAISALVNLKGIGVATASAILCACFPEICPFMADECLDSVPGIENTNYTVNEFIAFADQIKACCERLQAEDATAKWTPHKVELTLWTHYWIKEMKLNLLEEMPTPEGLDDEMEETGSNDVKNNKSNGDSHKLSSSSATNGSGGGVGVGGGVLERGGGGGGGNGEKVLDEDSNISVPVSNASEVEDGKSNEEEDEEDDDSRSGDVARRNNGTSRNMSKSALHMINNSNTNSSSAYNCIEDSNLSYSNLSSDDLNNSTTENTVDNTLDGPTNLTTSNNNNAITTTTTTTTNNNNISNNNDNSTNSNNSNNCSSSSSNVSTTTTTTPTPPTTTSSSSSLSPLEPFAPPPPPPVAAVPVAKEEAESESESISTTNNGHVEVNSNGENCKKMDRNNEIISEMVCSSMDDVVSSNSIKRPLEEISSTGDGLDDGSIDKKPRIE